MKTLNQNTALTLVQQFNLENLVNERANIIGEGWSDIRVDSNFRDNSIDEIVNLLNIRKEDNKYLVKRKLRNEPLHSWFGNRFIYTERGWQYVAGQDYTTEIANIRRELYK